MIQWKEQRGQLNEAQLNIGIAPKKNYANRLRVTPTHGAYLDNSTYAGLTVDKGYRGRLSPPPKLNICIATEDVNKNVAIRAANQHPVDKHAVVLRQHVRTIATAAKNISW